VFPQLADQGSLAKLLVEICDHAKTLGYAKVWLVPNVIKEPLCAPALKPVAEHLGRPLELVPSSGMVALNLG
jgi:hypothetical protein